MKIIFWGSPSFAIPTLQSLYEAGYPILAVVTQPDKPKGRNKKYKPSPVKEFAEQHKIQVLQPKNPNKKEFANTLIQLAPDAMVVVAYGKIFKKRLLSIPRYGYLNIHFSLLPKYRGASPIPAAILAGEKETGVTVIKLVRKMDAGPILGAKSILIEETDTTETLQNKLASLGTQLLLDILEKLPKGNVQELPQEEEKATYCSILEKKDGLINWSKSAIYLERFVRAMYPWPGAYTFWHRKDKNSSYERIIIHKSQVVQQTSSAPVGTIVALTEQGMDVATGEHCLRILQLQKAGKNSQPIDSFLRGTRIRVGDIFTDCH